MKYYSEILNKNFDTVKELEEAVNKYNAAVDEYDRAREAYIKARNNYYKLVGDVPGRCSSGMIDDIWKKLFEEYF